ncbi:MAG: 23S rRNA pseudouridine(1911/1915/1917) synthase RluD [Xanthomonadales bacterium]|nr:23S rRNA pseudouridine(1911/1915/1917) synthase RluD [Xanthomonadales bacterium]
MNVRPDSSRPSTDQSPAIREAEVGTAEAGLRFDQALAQLFPAYSRSRLAAWIKSGDATVEGAQRRPRDPVLAGERVQVRVPDEPALDDQAEAIALDILHADEHLLVVNKPPGLVVHPGAGNRSGTLVNALLHHDPSLAALPRAGIVHRLDKDTSGALLVARRLESHAALVALLAARDIHRRYEAVVLGTLVAGGTIDAPLDRHPHDRLKRAVVEEGRPAVTHFRIRERFRAHTRVQADLETGRTHQIRVHFAHRGHPLLGDPLYGGLRRPPKGADDETLAVLRGFRRQALHAERLSFVHPVSGDELAVEAPRPADLETLIARLRRDTEANPPEWA